jgi:class 3 adenylate cyclase
MTSVGKASTSVSLSGAKSYRKQSSYSQYAGAIVDSNYWILFSTVLIIFALLGDDLRRWLFVDNPHNADDIFNGLVWFAFGAFSLEMILSTVGKDAYFLGFFFYLDVVSTATVIMDVTYINQSLEAIISSLLGGSDGDGLKAGRTARIGAKAGRIIRLVRILKLYKAVYEARVRRWQREERLRRGEVEPDDEWDEEDYETNTEHQQTNESRVGKKLSDITTRRVIFIILALMIAMPIVSTEDEALIDTYAAEFGATAVSNAYQAYVSNNASASSYAATMLSYLYYHNFFRPCRNVEHGDCNQEENFFDHIIWFGVTSENGGLRDKIAHGAQLNRSDVLELNDERATLYKYGRMPEKVVELLYSPWTTECTETTIQGKEVHYKGVSLLVADNYNPYKMKFEPNNLKSHIKCPPSDLRWSEYVKVVSPEIADDPNWSFAFFFDDRAFETTAAIWNIVQTFFIALMLVLGSAGFSADANRLVVNPVEKMIKRVEAIRDDPLKAIKMADEEFKAELVAQDKEKRRMSAAGMMRVLEGFFSCSVCKSSTKSAPSETMILERTIIKLGSLLALGFGEAGANIIGQNMRGGDSAGVNAMIPGARVECILGLARVSDFSTAIEVLQGKIMTFVNQIAEIVHGVVNGYHGAPNKNNGDSFLVIWRLDKDKNVQEDLAKEKWRITRIAEMSVVSFAKVLGAVHQSPLLAYYRGHPGLKFRLGCNCRVNLTFGLHKGWAIEGAVGSEFKIDASYLSPNVSIATGVERCTKIYRVALMISQPVVQHCSQGLVRKCRLIDRVILTGSPQPIGLYCLDLDYMTVEVSRAKALTLNWNSRNRFKARQMLESDKNKVFGEQFDVAGIFEQDRVLKEMRARYTEEFFQVFNMGFQNYVLGEWHVARRMLSCTRVILGNGLEDGPSDALLRFMEVPYMFEAPKGWASVREISAQDLGI